MKQIIKRMIILLVALLMLSTVQAATVVIEPTAPASVIPGTFFPLILKITNSNPIPLENLGVDLQLPRTFDVEREDRTIPLLAPGQSTVLNWNVRVHSSASARYETISVRLSSATVNQDLDIPILVKGIESTLELEKVQASDLEPGKDGNITLQLRNHASYQLRDIRVALELNLPSPNPISPITPSSATEESLVESLAAGEETIMQINIHALPQAQAGSYTIPLRISYFDQFGQPYTKTNSIGLTISSVPELQITVEEKAVADKPKEVTLKVVNTGLTPIQSLVIRMQHPAIISTSSLYVGSLERDDFQTEHITVLSSESFPLPLTVEFRDAQNKQYTQIVTVPIDVVDKATAQSLGLESSFPWVYVLLPIVVVLLIYAMRKNAIRKMRQKKPTPKA